MIYTHLFFRNDGKNTGDSLLYIFDASRIAQLSDRVLKTEVEQLFLILLVLIFKLRYAEISKFLGIHTIHLLPLGLTFLP